jgi:hypothetical protein
MLIVLLLVAMLVPPPLTSMSVDPQPSPDHLDVVVHFLNSDTRYQDFAITVGDVTTPITAPVSALQTVTTTLPFDLPPLCNAQAVYNVVVTARVLTDTTAFARTEIGGVARRECLHFLYVP